MTPAPPTSNSPDSKDEAASALFRKFFSISPDGIVLLDNDDRILKANPAFLQLFGYAIDEVLGRPINELIVDPGNSHAAKDLSRRALNAEVVQQEARRLRSDGTAIYVEIFGTPVMIDERQVGIYAIYRDISDRVKALHALRHSEELFQLVTEHTGQLVYDYDLETGIIDWSGAVRSVLGLSRSGTRRFNIDRWAERLHPEDRKRCVHLMEQTERSGEPFHVEYRLRRLGDEYIHVEDRGAYLHDEPGQPTRLIGTLTDITQRKAQEEAIAYQATHDALTGLANRFRFEEAVNQLGRIATDTGREHTLLYMDLDQFKVVNDTCGHNAGDELLRQISDRIDELVRPEDLLARLGGDEFGLLLVDTDTEQGARTAEKIIAAVNSFRFNWQEHRFTIGISIGLVALDGSLDFIDLLKAADQACYAAKDQGRNRFHIYHEQDRLLRQRSAELAAVADVGAAIAEKRFELHAQRIVDLLDDRSSHGYEILLRMRDRRGELIPPGEFILGAERYGRMNELDRWVVEHALQRIGEQDHSAGTTSAGAPWFSINLSGITVGDTGFGDFVCEAVKRHKVDPTRICFEITESAAITHHRHAVRFFNTVRAMGCRVMLDDFGSGLSSFAYLKTLPIDFIKLDGSLIHDLGRSDFSHAIVRAIHDVARALHIPLIAEHVETPEVLDQLNAIGVEYAQGFLLHRPSPWLVPTGMTPQRPARSGSC
ncbi:EAL domain-containing protein [Wenzhouxiangella sp. AB-CW3]|uniref:putative bifunctional diguanylate cyclase/phosphodiesterase n=1 Tax=Wenzhouxiangella sp. AB-CW3 TaxID=2771012 RepID=UPI00168A4CDA|nr:EAL domain-containing protein [Wenzhouxiangella sp. AB-CW3]QOC22546.1 EAL domain-containing protein [Wenzhouxiangella sp. AB-CW3]